MFLLLLLNLGNFKALGKTDHIMKITIQTSKTIKKQKTHLVLKSEIKRILDKLVHMNTSFFSWDGDSLKAEQCANTETHNRLIILLALFTDSNIATFTEFGNKGTSFRNFRTIESLENLLSFVESIDLKNCEIEIK
jgi:hypothetical protein